MHTEQQTSWRLSAKQVSSRIGAEELAILQLESGRYFGLDQVGVVVWEHLQGHSPATLADLVSVIQGNYDVDAAQCRRDVAALMDELHAEGLVERIEIQDS